jgi:hypothetical protein
MLLTSPLPIFRMKACSICMFVSGVYPSRRTAVSIPYTVEDYAALKTLIRNSSRSRLVDVLKVETA